MSKKINALKQQQKDAYLKGIKKKVFAIFSKVGTGKTKIALDLINERFKDNKVDNLLWVSLKALTKEQTPSEIKKWYPYLSNKSKFINVEKISRMDINEIDSFCEEFNVNEKTFLVLDESLKIKNIEAKRTKFLLMLSQRCKYKLILNGTPISKNIGDLYTQFSFLDKRILNYRDYQDFVNKHFEFYKHSPWKILDLHNLDYLKEQIKDFIYDANLNDKMPIIEKLEASSLFDDYLDKQEKKWKELMEKIREKDDFIPDDLILKRFNKLYLATEYSEGKFTRLKQFIQDNTKKQIIIMCRFMENVKKIKEELGDKAIIYTGEQKDDLSLFKSKQVNYLIMGMRVGSFGIDGLQSNCHTMLFYDYPLSPDEIIQSTGRINRFGQTKECQFYQIILLTSTINSMMDKLITYKSTSLNTLNSTINNIVKEAINETSNIK